MPIPLKSRYEISEEREDQFLEVRSLQLLVKNLNLPISKMPRIELAILACPEPAPAAHGGEPTQWELLLQDLIV